MSTYMSSRMSQPNSQQLSLQNSISEPTEGKRRCCGLMKSKKAYSVHPSEAGEGFDNDRSTQYQLGTHDGSLAVASSFEELRHSIRAITEEVHEQSQDLTALLQKTLLSGGSRTGRSLASKSVLTEDGTVAGGENVALAVAASATADPEKPAHMTLPEALLAIQHSVESFARDGEGGRSQELTFTLDHLTTSVGGRQVNTDASKPALGRAVSSPASLPKESEWGYKKPTPSTTSSTAVAAAAAAANPPSLRSEASKACHDNLPEALETMRQSIEGLAQAVHKDNAELSRLIREFMVNPPACADTLRSVGSQAASSAPRTSAPATGDLRELQLGLQELDEEIHRQNRQMRSLLLQSLDLPPEVIAEVTQQSHSSSGGRALRRKGGASGRTEDSSLAELKHKGTREELLPDDMGTSMASLPGLTTAIPDVAEPLRSLQEAVRQLEADIKADKRGSGLGRTIDAIQASAETIRSEIEKPPPPPPPPSLSRKDTNVQRQQQELGISDPLVQAVLDMVRQVVRARTRTTSTSTEGTNAEAMKVVGELRKCLQSCPIEAAAAAGGGRSLLSAASGGGGHPNNVRNMSTSEGISLIVQMVKGRRV